MCAPLLLFLIHQVRRQATDDDAERRAPPASAILCPAALVRGRPRPLPEAGRDARGPRVVLHQRLLGQSRRARRARGTVIGRPRAALANEVVAAASPRSLFRPARTKTRGCQGATTGLPHVRPSVAGSRCFSLARARLLALAVEGSGGRRRWRQRGRRRRRRRSGGLAQPAGDRSGASPRFDRGMRPLGSIGCRLRPTASSRPRLATRDSECARRPPPRAPPRGLDPSARHKHTRTNEQTKRPHKRSAVRAL